MPEPDQQKWTGIRPTDPKENIPVEPGVNADITKGAMAEDGTVIIHTVTTGKILRLTAATFSIFNAGGAAGLGCLRVRNGADVTQYDIFTLHAVANSQMADSTPFFWPILIPASWDIVAISPAANFESHGFIAGDEINA